jgi:hypothetical protein
MELLMFSRQDSKRARNLSQKLSITQDNTADRVTSHRSHRDADFSLIKIKQRDRSCEEDNESILEYLSFAVG